MISGARLFNYCEPASKLARLEFAEKVIKGALAMIQFFPLTSTMDLKS
jgi:hypothetical protein